MNKVWIVWTKGAGPWAEKIIERVFATEQGAHGYIADIFAEDEHADCYDWVVTEEEVH